MRDQSFYSKLRSRMTRRGWTLSKVGGLFSWQPPYKIQATKEDHVFVAQSIEALYEKVMAYENDKGLKNN